jgi:hypothetical protein
LEDAVRLSDLENSNFPYLLYDKKNKFDNKSISKPT